MFSFGIEFDASSTRRAYVSAAHIPHGPSLGATARLSLRLVRAIVCVGVGI